MRDKKRTTPLLLCSLVGVLVATTVAAATSSQPGNDGAFRESITVELVTVEAWVTNRHGQAVSGLGPADFEVLHDGTPVVITHFSEVKDGVVVPLALRAAATGSEAGTAEPGERGAQASTVPAEEEPSIVPIAAEPHHAVVYIDQLHLAPQGYRRTIEGLRQLLASHAIAPERVLILRQDNDLHMEVPFGSSEDELEAALTRLAEQGNLASSVAFETKRVVDELKGIWVQAQTLADGAAIGLSQTLVHGNGGGPLGSPAGTVDDGTGGTLNRVDPDLTTETCDHFHDRIGGVIQSWVFERTSELSRSMQLLAGAATFVASLPGIKTFFYVSDGLSMSPGSSLISFVDGLCPVKDSELTFDTLREQAGQLFLTMTRHLNSNRVTVYAVQGSGLQALSSSAADHGGGGFGVQTISGHASSSFDAARRASDLQGLSFIASQTGGRVVSNTNNIAGEMGAIAREMQSYYSFAYPLPQTDDGPEHKITVKLADSSLKVRYRKGYLAKDSDQRMNETMEGALNLGLTSNPLAIRLGAGELNEREDGSFAQELVTLIPSENVTFLPADGMYLGRLKLKVLAKNLDSDKVGMLDKRFSAVRPVSPGSLSLPIGMVLNKGSYLIVVGVRDEVTNETSVVSTNLSIGL